MAFNAQTIALALRLETGQFTAGLGMAGARVRTFAADVKKSAGESGRAMQDMAAKSDKGLNTLANGALIAGGAIVAGFAIAVRSAMEFDKTMSEVGAVSGATGDSLGLLRQAAIDAGAATVFSASQAAQAEAELAKAGVSTRDILAGGLTGALNLASAGSLDLATAAEIAANALNTFQLSGADIPHVADLLAGAANKSATDVAEMGMAMKQGGGQASAMGVSIEDTVGTLALFAQYALKGSDGGTSFKTMLASLAGNSGTARQAIADLNLRFYDANGNFLGLANAAEELKTKLGPLSDEQRTLALNTIFGTDASRAAVALMREGGAGVQRWAHEVDEAGYAAELAGIKTDNLSGDLEQLHGSLETALIQGGSQATGALRNLTQGATDLVNGFSALPEPIQNTVIGLSGITAGAGLLFGAYVKLEPVLGRVKTTLEGMGGIGAAVAGNFNTIGLASAGLMIPLGLLATAWMTHNAEIQGNINLERDLAKALAATTKSIDEGTDAWLRRQLVEGDERAKSMGDTLAGTNVDMVRLTAGIRENGTELDRWRGRIADYDDKWADLRPEIEAAAASGNKAAQSLLFLADSSGKSGGELEQLIRDMDYWNDRVDGAVPRTDFYRNLLAETGDTASTTAGATSDLGTATAGAGRSAEEAAQGFKDAADAVNGYYDATTSVLSANIDFQAALDDIAESIKEHGASLDIDSEAGRSNTRAIIEAKDAAIQHGLEMLRGGASIAEATTETLRHVDALRETMRQAGLTDDQINILLTNMGLTPESILTQFNTPGLVEANTRTDLLQQVVVGLNGQVVTITIGLDDWRFWSNANAVSAWLNSLSLEQQKAAASTIAGVHADGHVVDFYAAGGVRDAEYFANGSENHIAQIAPAGSWRVWAEPETGGEAYIPFAASKRTRSVAIWREVGHRLGVGQAGTSVALAYSPQFSFPNYLGDRRDLEQAMRAVLRDNKAEVAALVAQHVKANS